MREVPAGTLMLTSGDVLSLLDPPDYVRIMEEAFEAHTSGRTFGVGMLHERSEHTEYHFKAGGLSHDGRSYYALKANSFSFENAKTYGLPSIMGLILLLSGDMAFPLACMDSVAITTRRTGATGALAAKYLARPDSTTALICGSGTQGGIQLEFLTSVLPITKAYVWSPTPERREKYAAAYASKLGIEVVPVESPGVVSRKVDVIITATPSSSPFIGANDVSPGTFIAAMGADSAHKQELHPDLLRANTLVTDITAQCAAVGELHHAIENGMMSAGNVSATIGEIVSGRKPGRSRPDETIIFDSTGTALQDAACAVACYLRAIDRGVGTLMKLN